MTFSGEKKGPLTGQNLEILYKVNKKSQATNTHHSLQFSVSLLHLPLSASLYDMQEAGLPSGFFTTQKLGIFLNTFCCY